MQKQRKNETEKKLGKNVEKNEHYCFWVFELV
jgi:hypothetical protein